MVCHWVSVVSLLLLLCWCGSSTSLWVWAQPGGGGGAGAGGGAGGAPSSSPSTSSTSSSSSSSTTTTTASSDVTSSGLTIDSSSWVEVGSEITASEVVANCATQTMYLGSKRLTIGPYYVNEMLNRTDLTVNTPVVGTPLYLTIYVYNSTQTGCQLLSNVTIDIWHASPQGLYSDVSSIGTYGTKYLRGYQISNYAGLVGFYTYHPGWYSGRAPHIHIRARVYTGGALSLDQTTQLFYSDSFNSEVYAANSNYTHGTQDTFDSTDTWYASSQLVTATGDVTGPLYTTYYLGLPMTSDTGSGVTTASPSS